MTDSIAVINAGSSSIKFSLFIEKGTDLIPGVRGQVEDLYAKAHFIVKDADGMIKIDKTWPEGTKLGHEEALDIIFFHIRSELSGNRLVGIGHRVVHGGQTYSGPASVNRKVLEDLESYIPLAPLHQPHNLAPVRRILERSPELPQVVCFDTSFHRTMPDVARMYALPADLHEAGIMRYGFHGLSYEYIASMLPDIDPRAAAGRTIVLHLGNGASMCAIKSGSSIASTMGFTAVEGLPMSTRSGSLDPGVILYLMDQRGMDARDIENLIYSQSGLFGVSGISSDLRTLVASGEPRAEMAVSLFVYRVCREMGSLTAALEGLDAVVFTAGIGENNPVIRSRVCQGASWMGIDIDEAANINGKGRISKDSSRVSVWVIPTNEELMIANHTRDLIKARGQ